MANTYEAEVIRYLRRKSSSGFESPTYLGAEQRFVGALRNSSVNNLEEQYILGTDTYTETYVDSNGNTIVEKSFHINDATHALTDYYKLITTIYKDGTMNEDFFIEDDKTPVVGPEVKRATLKLPYDMNEVFFGYNPLVPGQPEPPFAENTIFGENDKTFVFEQEDLRIYPSSYTTIKKEELHYISNNGANDLLVLTKITGKKYTDDGAKEVIRESITNYIN